MKRIFAVLFFGVLFVTAFSQDFDLSRYSFVGESSSGVYLVAIGGKINDGILENAKWGFLDKTGNELVKPKYDFIGEFQNDFALVKQGSKFGLLRKDYKEIIPCKYSAIGSFNKRGLVWVNVGGRESDKNPEIFVGGQFGVMDSSGRTIVPLKYKAIGTFIRKRSENANPFASFTAIPKHLKSMERGVGRYDIHEYEYVETRMLEQMQMDVDDFIIVSESGDFSRDGIYASDGQLILPPGTVDKFYNPSEGMIPVSRFVGGSLQTNYFVVKEQGLLFKNWVPVDCITPFKTGRAIIAVHRRNTVINHSGQKLGIPYDIIFPSETGIYVTMNSSRKFGLMDNDGNEILAPAYAEILPMREGKMVARKELGSLCGFINSSGQEVIPPKYLAAMSFHNGSAMVKTESGWGLINDKGTELIACRWFSIVPPTEENPDYIWVRKEQGGLAYCINRVTDDYAFEKGFATALNFNFDFRGVAFVFDSSRKVGCIDEKGNQLVPCVFNDITEMRNEYSAMLKDGKTHWDKIDEWRWALRKSEENIIHKLSETIKESSWDY